MDSQLREPTSSAFRDLPPLNIARRQSATFSHRGAAPPLGSPSSQLHFRDPHQQQQDDDHPARRRRRSSTAMSMRSLVTVTRSPLASPVPRSLDGNPFNILPEQAVRYAGSGSEEDPYIVCFDEGDPINPRNWRTSYRWWIMSCATLEMIGGTLAISIFTPGFNGMRTTFGVEREVVVVSTTLYMTALAISSLITAPLGELYGRKPVMAISFLLFALSGVGVALSPNVGCLLAMRFISGLFGSASMSHGPAMASDLFAPHEVALPLTFAAVGRFAGPSLGPLLGSWIAERAGWRWIAWTQCIFTGALTVLAALMVPETYGPAILRKRARVLAKEVGATHITSFDSGRVIGGWKEEAKEYLVRPFLFLTLEPIVLLLSLHVSFLYGILNLYFSAYPYVFTTERGWTAGRAGLPFVAVFLGFLVSMPISLYFGRRYNRAAAAAPSGKAPPEQRLPFAILGAGLLPVSLFWLGWTATPSVHWLAPTASGIVFSVGQMGLSVAVFSYFSDAYTFRFGSVLAGSNFMRFLVGGVFPLFSSQMFARLGAGWALTLLALLCIVFFPAPIVFYVYGARIRAWSKYAPPELPDVEKASSTATPAPGDMATVTGLAPSPEPASAQAVAGARPVTVDDIVHDQNFPAGKGSRPDS